MLFHIYDEHVRVWCVIFPITTLNPDFFNKFIKPITSPLENLSEEYVISYDDVTQILIKVWKLKSKYC